MIKALSYVGFSSPAADEWRTFGPEILGLEDTSSETEDGVRLRVDEAVWRIAVHPGEANSLDYIGWDAGSSGDLEASAQAIEANGHVVTRGDATLAAQRGVAEVVFFTDPFGFRHELTIGRQNGETPFASAHDVRFVTGKNGLGHLVLMVSDLDAATTFFMDLLGFRHSDDIDVGMKIRFFHCNPRHHTLAITQMPGHRGIHHLMLEVESFDQVGLAYDRAIAADIPLAMTLGRHPNDEMTSFYVRSPSGFEVEFGSGGRLMDMGGEPVGQYDAMSIWGHKPPAERLFPGAVQPL